MTPSTGRRAVVTLPSPTQIHVVREFDAPAHLVYKAWTTPELIRRWWHAGRGEVTEATVDLRVGGRWRFVMRTDRGFEVAFHGEYLEIVPNERVVSTEIYEGAPEAPARTTIRFAPEGNRTRVTLIIETRTQADRDAQLATGMEDGMQDGLALLEEVAASLA